MRARRIIYLVMIVAVAAPILLGFSQRPSRLESAERMYAVVEGVQVQPGEVAVVWLDFGPNTTAENEPQAIVLLEHLFRRHIPVVLLSQYQQSERFLESIPLKVAKRLEEEMPGQEWRYGDAWVNAGYRPGSGIFIQSMVSSPDLTKFLVRDVQGMPLSHYPKFAAIGGIERVKLVGEITGLVGVFDNIIQFLQKDGYRPTIVHGCTSITIPEAYIFLDSAQLKGLLEGIAGAAWYSEVLRRAHPQSDNKKLLITNTSLGLAHLVLILLIIVGNVAPLIARGRRSDG